MGIHVDNVSHVGTIGHDYGSMIVNIAFFSCPIEQSEMTPNVHDEFLWVSEDEAAALNWLPADVEFVEQLIDTGFSSI